MVLRDYLNEFELDWAQAPVRSELIPGKQLSGAKVLLIGEQSRLQEAIAWSFLAWNDRMNAGIQGSEASWKGDSLVSGNNAFDLQEADYVILTGYCCREMDRNAAEVLAYMKKFEKMLRIIGGWNCRRVLLLSDGRVYGRLPHAFAASEYETGQTDTQSPEFEAQYFLQSLEGMFVSRGREAGFAYNILRTGLIYGPCIPMLDHPLAVLAAKTAREEDTELTLSPERSSYICIHDLLTAVQFVLTGCPANKIFNASGPDAGQSIGELAMILYQNFPEQCRIRLSTAGCPEPVHEGQTEEQKTEEQKTEKKRTVDSLTRHGILLNTQLLCHYGFEPKISVEDGLIILVKYLQNTGEVFIFDNTYLGKLEKVQQILLGYLLEIDRICKKHHIKYFLAGGTLLGAIRHHGFIPWDDDADVMMLREDYDKFQQVAKQELPDNIFVQLPTTEKGNYNPFTKLRINNTMFATEFTGHFMEMHNGIFFDVLSHDRTGQHGWSQKLHLMVTMLTRSVVFNKWGNTDVKGGGKHPIICKIVSKAKYLIPMPFAVWAQNRSLEFFRNRKTEYLYDGMGRNLKRGAFPAKWLEEAVYVDFEGYQFPVPKEYDKYLTYLYGDYMQMIPVSQRRTSHSIVLTDLGEYSDFYLMERRNGKCFQ